jgi:hypothetical protein
MAFDMFNNDARESERVFRQQQDGQKEISMLDSATHPQTELIQLQQQKEREDLVRWQQDLGGELKQLERDLRREVFDELINKWVPMKIFTGYRKDINNKPKPVFEDAAQVCNDFGIMMIKTNLRPLMGKNIMMSNLSEERILQILKSTLKTIIRNICIKHDFYEVDFHDISYIRQTIQNAALPAPFRALSNGERKYLTSTTRSIEQTMNRPATEQKGIMGLKFG